MGFSPGEFKTKSGEEFFFEGGGAGIELFGPDGKVIFIISDAKQALEAASQLMLLAEMLTENRL